MLVLFILVLGINALAQNVNVTATGGTPAATYPTLTGAFNAINAGTHTGTITVDVALSTTEGATPAVLNSSGAGAASYASILIRPSADGVTVAGATPTGRGVIELNGADNVTIDGDNPGTAGINRNLTIQNTAAATVAFTSVIRIALATSIVTSADNDTIRNLNLIGNATGRNTAATNSTTGSENTTYGVLASAGASTVAATTAPSAVSAVATTIGAPATAANLSIDNNNVQTVARGIAVQGAATTVFPGMAISNNLIGNSTASAVDQVYSVGITAQGSANGSIAGNTVYIESFLPSSTSAANRAIDVGGISAIGTFTIERNKVNRAKNNAPDFWLAHGINLAGGNNHIVRNNFVSDITLNTTSGGFYSTTFAAVGIRVAAGTGHQIYHNSVNMFGTIPGATPTITAAFMIAATASTGVDVRNNIFVNTLTGGGGTSAHVAVFLPSGATSAMNLTINNNDYWNGAAPTATQGVGQVGTTAGTGFFTQANFDPSVTTPASNFRSYTSTLNASGTNDNASKKVDPQFVSATDLHIAVASPMVDMGAAVGVVNDIDSQARVAAPDIGADEPSGITPPANDIAATAILVPANGATFATGATVTPQASFTNAGSAAQTNVQVTFTITGPGGYNYTNNQIIAAINPNQTVVVNFAVTPPFTTVGTYNMTAAVTTPDANAANNSVAGSYNVIGAFGGSVSVGTGQTYTSLTNPGGIFQAINSVGSTGNITINIVSDLTGETGAVSLNEIAGGFSVIIKPSGAARTISGTAPAAGGLLGFNGTDNVTIDGSLSGGNDRSLTLQPSNATVTGGGIYFASGAAGAQNNTVKNLNVFGAGANAGVLLGITFAGNTFGGLGADNDNNRIINNDIRGAFYGIASLGASSANKDTGTIIAYNVMPGVGTAGIGRVGIYIIFNDAGQVVANNIASVANPGSVDTIAIAAGSQALSNVALASGGVSNIVISRNYIGVVTNNATFSSAGIVLASEATGTNRVDNNMITGVTGNANAGDIVAGIYVNPIAGATQNIYYNSVSMTGDRGSATTNLFPSYALAISQDQPTNVINNALVNSQTHTGSTGGGGESYAIGFDGPAANVNLTSNNNDLFVSGPIGQVGITGDLTTAAQGGTAGTGTNRTTLAAWQAATGEDAASVSVNPLWVSTTDLHLQVTSPLQDLGVTIAAVPKDYDLQSRAQPAPPPVGGDSDETLGIGNTDIGADEILAPNSANINIGGRVVTSDGQTGVVKARVTLSGGDLSQPIAVRTNPFGYYSFEGLQVGQTYILTVESKRYTFVVPTIVITPDDNIQNADFTANPIE
jgi:hypothetical protein